MLAAQTGRAPRSTRRQTVSTFIPRHSRIRCRNIPADLLAAGAQNVGGILRPAIEPGQDEDGSGRGGAGRGPRAPGAGRGPAAAAPAGFGGRGGRGRGAFVGPSVAVQGLPLIKPPYDRITAYDMNTGDIVW